MDPSLLVAFAALLLAPGPTNAMLAASAAGAGWRAGGGIPAVILAYFVALTAYSWLLPAVANAPALLTGLKVAGAIWLTFCAWRGLRSGPAKSRREKMRGTTIFMTTLVNPKPAVIALMAGAQGDLVALLSIAVPLAAGAGGLWLGLGMLAGRAGAGPHAAKAGALVNGLFAALLAASAAGLAGA